MQHKSFHIFALSTSVLIFWNSSVLSNTLRDSAELINNHVDFATPDFGGQTTKFSQQIAQETTNNRDISGQWIGKFTCGQTDFPVSVKFRQVPRDSFNINILADIGPNPPTGEDTKTFKGAFDPKSLVMTLAGNLDEQIWVISGHFDSELRNFTTDKSTPPCLLTLYSLDKRIKSPMIVYPQTSSSTPETTQPSTPETTQPSKPLSSLNPTPSSRPTNVQSNVSLAGKWQSDWGPVVFNADLTGYWNQGSGVGQIKDGTYNPETHKLIFHYYQSWNDMNGTATLTLSKDGNRLSGSWTQQRGSNPPGSGGSGGWTMTRDRS